LAADVQRSTAAFTQAGIGTVRTWQWLNGKRVVVTGGSQGLGLAMVKALVASGANVTAMSRDPSNLKAAAELGPR
jgi:D-arabinose 1-dehydrogenase-like Zn-dependent alcohol dehydrogenase